MVVASLLLAALLASGCALDRSGLGGVADAAGRPDGGDARPVDGGGGDRRDGGRDSGSPGDGGASDAAPPEDFHDVHWGTPEPVPSVDEPSRCETDPVTTTDLRWLFVSRDASGGCLTGRRFHLYRWNAGSPTLVGMLPRFDRRASDETNPHALDGRFASRRGSIVFMHAASGMGAASNDIRWVELSGDPPAPTGSAMPVSAVNGPSSESMPTMTREGRIMVFTRDNDLWQAVGSPPEGWVSVELLTSVSTMHSEIDPALSPDGRVLVFERILVGDPDADLWVARRRDPLDEFGPPVRLPKGGFDSINSPFVEADPHITSRGDLLYASTRPDDTFRVFIARRR